MEHTIAEAVVLEKIADEAREAALQQLDQAQLALIGGGVGEIVFS